MAEREQQTLGRAVEFSGIGLHCGEPVRLRFLPASPGTGLRFRRVDLEGKPEIEAAVSNVAETNRSTTLAKGGVKIHTVEHVLATFAGFQIDNAVIELDANEPPIGDGSAREFCRMIRSAGVVGQGDLQRVEEIAEPIHFECGESNISVFPHAGLKITCTSADRQGRFTQYYSVEVNPKSWEQDLASARTFCFFEEIEYLIRNGLIRGGSLENAVVIRDDAVLTNEPLRYPEEFVRHKILDIIGDLALLGRPFRGHIVAIKPSHAANCELARRLHQRMKEPVSSPLESASDTESTLEPTPDPSPAGTPAAADSAPNAPESTALDTVEIMKILPHRYPILMVDRVTRIEGNRIVAFKNVSGNEPFFQGHFPGHPVMPGVLQLEAIAQVAGVLMLKQIENYGKIAYFASAERVKWRKPVRPGDRLVIDVELTKFRGKIAKAKGVCSVDGDVVSEAEITVMLTVA